MRLYNRILVVAAHPDDEILGCGGLLSLQSALGASIRVIFGAEVILSIFKSQCRSGSNDIVHRNACAHRSLSLLGVNDLGFSFVDVWILPIIDINKIIESKFVTLIPFLFFPIHPMITTMIIN